MTKMLDVLESFVNLHGYTYLRLDGSTKPEDRQISMQRFNTNPKIFLFILSTRSGGVGVNLVGADTVIFYDSDWNPAMDQQAQDRCHRIGQTREVHIYRLISESTIEENILKKANQKRFLDDLVIQSGSYNTDFFKKLDPSELLCGLKGVKVGQQALSESTSETSGAAQVPGHELSNVDVEAALRIAEDEADYMALKKVEQEEAAEHQEFTEEAYSSRMEEDEYADDLDEGKGAERGMQSNDLPSKLEADDAGYAITPQDIDVINVDLDEDMDMLADVKQMAAAAAAAGNGGVSFDDQLCPTEKYAMRFLEIWNPIVDKAAVENQVAFEETEWELDQLETLKQAQEAEIDEDNEPLLYESKHTTLSFSSLFD
jgi:E1A-binding protein p400